MPTEIELLLRVIDEAFDHKSWHGTNLRGSLRGLPVNVAAWRSQPARRNIWEITLHSAYWKYTIRRRLLGEKRGSFPLKGSNWFERPTTNGNDEAHWKTDLEMLISTHKTLRTAVSQLSPKDLRKKASGGSTSILTLITGIAAHDVYHAGQIQLIKKLYAEQDICR